MLHHEIYAVTPCKSLFYVFSHNYRKNRFGQVLVKYTRFSVLFRLQTDIRLTGYHAITEGHVCRHEAS